MRVHAIQLQRDPSHWGEHFQTFLYSSAGVLLWFDVFHVCAGSARAVRHTRKNGHVHI